MDRREFFGSVIGLMAASRLPFIAEQLFFDIPNIDPLRQQALLEKLFFSKREDQMKYKMGVWLVDGTFMRGGGGIKDVETSPYRLSLISEPILMTRELDAKGLVLLTPGNEYIKHWAYNSDVHLNPDDTLNQTMSFNVAREFATKEPYDVEFDYKYSSTTLTDLRSQEPTQALSSDT